MQRTGCAVLSCLVLLLPADFGANSLIVRHLCAYDDRAAGSCDLREEVLNRDTLPMHSAADEVVADEGDNFA